MADPLSSTVWPPTTIPDGTKKLLAHFLQTVDLKDPSAGQVLANDIFVPDGQLIASNGAFNGQAEISKCRENAWDAVDYRQHTIDKAFSGNKQGTDMILVGKLKMRMKGSEQTTLMEFAARALVDESTPESPRLKLWAPYGGSTQTE